jgi:hypothetical protein
MVDTEKGLEKRRSLLERLTCHSGTAQDRRNQYLFIAWCMVWAIVFTISNQVLKSGPQISVALKMFIAIVPIALGIGAVFAYTKFLRQADELIRKMQIDGLAFGFGVGIVFTLCYQVLERAGAPHLEIDDAAVVMMGGWMLGQVIAFWRYK